MLRLWYKFVQLYMKTGLWFYYKNVRVFGKENIPKKGAVMFIGNHQNALIDALLVPTSNNRNIHFLTRAAVFKNPIAKWWLSTVNMLPIYRIRDGRNELNKNKGIFETCFQILNKEDALLIFPEGSHHLNRRVRPLSKGFTRILFGAMELHPELNIQIIPIGFNYDKGAAYPSSVCLHYGKPIQANGFYHKNDLNKSVNEIKEVCFNALTTLTTHIEEADKHDAIVAELEKNGADFLNPTETNKLIKKLGTLTSNVINKKKEKKHWLYYIVVLNSIAPWLVWKKASAKVDELEFKSTFRFAVGITLFPIFYVLQSFVLTYLFGSTVGWLYFTFSVLLVLVYTKK